VQSEVNLRGESTLQGPHQLAVNCTRVKRLLSGRRAARSSSGPALRMCLRVKGVEEKERMEGAVERDRRTRGVRNMVRRLSRGVE